MPDAPADPIAPHPPARPRRAGRWLFALAFVALPLLGVAALAAVWARSCRVEERWAIGRNREVYDPATQIDTQDEASLILDRPRGLLALTFDLKRTWRRITPNGPIYPYVVRRGLALPARWGAWSEGFNRVGEVPRFTRYAGCLVRPTGAEAFGLEADAVGGRPLFLARDPNRPLDLPRGDGGLRPLTFWRWRSSTQGDATDRTHQSHLVVVAPLWAWMLPLGAPLAWWLWCPAGRFVPRLTLRRTALATAGLGLVLALICRPSAADHGVLSLNEFGPDWYYAPDPADPRRPALVGLSLGLVDGEDTPLAADEVAAIRRALAGLPQLRYLTLATANGPRSIETSLLPDEFPSLEVLAMPGSQADDATVARLAAYPNLRRLDLRLTQVTDAGLAPLRGLRRLTHLLLGGLPLTDAGLAPLHGLPDLRRLDFRAQLADDPEEGTRAGPVALSDGALRRLADSLPRFEELIRPDGSILARHPAHPGPGPEDR